MSIKAIFARNLRAFRRTHRLTQRQLSMAADVSRNTFIEWEKADSRALPDAERLDALAAVDPSGNTPAAWFFIDWRGEGLAFLERRVQVEERSVKRRMRLASEFKELLAHDRKALAQLLREEGIIR